MGRSSRSWLVASSQGDGLAAVEGRLGDRGEDLHVVETVLQRRHCGQPVEAGHLVQEGASLPGEEVVLPVTHRREVHRQTSLEVRVVRAEEDLARTIDDAGRTLVGEGELSRTVQVVRRRAPL